MVLWVGLTYVPLHPKFKQMGFWHGHGVSWFSVQIPKLWSGCLWDPDVGFLESSEQDRSMVLGSRESGSVFCGSAPSPSGQSLFDVVGHNVHALVQEKGKPNNAECVLCWKSRIPKQVGQKWNVLHQKAKHESVACYRFPLLSFITVTEACSASIYSYLGSQAWVFHLPRWPASLCEGWCFCADKVCVPGPVHVITYLLPPWRHAVANRRIIRKAQAGDLRKVWVLS